MKKRWFVIAGVALVLALGVAAIFIFGGDKKPDTDTRDNNESVTEEADENTYETPLKAFAEYMSTPAPAWDKIPAVYNGWAQKEVKEIYKVLGQIYDELKVTEMDIEEAWSRPWTNPMTDYEREFGRDAQMSYVINETKEMTPEEQEEYQKGLGIFARERKEKWNGDAHDYVADMVEDVKISEALAQELLDACRAYMDKLESAVIEEGYWVKATVTITSSALEEPHQENVRFLVYKVDGRWVLCLVPMRYYSLDPVYYYIYALELL